MKADVRRPAGLFCALVLLLAALPASARPALWAVRGDGPTVWLFGSVHVLPQGGFDIESGLADAWKSAKSVCLEVDMSALTPEEATRATLTHAIDPNGRSLFDLLGDDANHVMERAAAAGIDLKPYALFEPWFASLTISLTVLKEHGYAPDHGVEQVIQQAAEAEGKAGCGLETVDQQLGYLDNLPAELQREMLLQSIDEASGLQAEMARLLSAWQDGDDATLARMLDEDFDEYPEVAELLVYQRNENWAGQVASFLDGEDDVLVVVGALHLVGDRGLPALLERRGFRVERR